MKGKRRGMEEIGREKRPGRGGRRLRAGGALLLAAVLLLGGMGPEKAFGAPFGSGRTEIPGEAKSPQGTEMPGETGAPQETEMPGKTKSPQETEMPGETETPQETVPPQETHIPQETKPPKETEAPGDAQEGFTLEQEDEVPGGSEQNGVPGQDTGLVQAAPVSFPGESVGEEEEILHAPRLILASNSLDGKPLEAGEVYELRVAFQNRSRTESIYNLKVSLDWEEPGLSLPISSGYQEKVSPLGTAEFVWEVRVAVGAEQKEVPLTFTLEYEDEKGTACTGTEKSVLSVRQQAQVQISGFFLEEAVYAADTLEKELKVQNTGRAPVYNVWVTAEGDGITPQEPLFLGDLEAQEEGAGSLLLYVGFKGEAAGAAETQGEGAGESPEDEDRYGSTAGRLILSYEDAFGQTYTQEQEFQTVIQKPRVMELKVEEPKPEQNQWKLSIFLFVVLLLLVVVIFLLLALAKSRRRLADARIVWEESREKNEKV